jgi:pSer/pThr/pTyr-binding forkhead associated (FHA) protein
MSEEGNPVGRESNEGENHASATHSATETSAFAAPLLDHAAAAHAELTSEENEAIAALPSGSGLLLVRRGPGLGSRFLLDSDVSVAGRHPNSEIFLDDVTVSRRHSEFRRTAQGFEMRDLGSLNGTFVGAERRDVAALHDGDELLVGKFHLTFFASPADLKGGR